MLQFQLGAMLVTENDQQCLPRPLFNAASDTQKQQNNQTHFAGGGGGGNGDFDGF